MDPDAYVLQHVREALASDPRTGELGLDVAFEGTALVISGVVGSAERRAAVLDVAREVAPEVEVVNRTEVKEVRPPAPQENIP